MRTPRCHTLLWPALGVSFLCAAIAFFLWHKGNKTRGLPYRDSFILGRSNEWTPLGGTWQLSGNTVRNASDDRGSKLLTGSHQWQNYSIEADVMLFGPFGDAGLIIRSNNEEEGVDSYDGYYAGIRNHGAGLVLGRADYSWVSESEELTESLGEIHSHIWYHLKVLAVGCYIAAEASLPQEGDQNATAIAVLDHRCMIDGRAGLRSYSSGGAWRNIQIKQAGQKDLDQMLTRTSTRKVSTQSTQPESLRAVNTASFPHDDPRTVIPSPNVKKIGDLWLSPSSANVVATISGVVTLTSPSVFIQDSSAGLELAGVSKESLNVGDEVEVKGRVHPGDFSSTLSEVVVRVLYGRTPPAPISVTALQAATGTFANAFVEVEGQLKKYNSQADGSVALSLVSGSEAFDAIIDRPHEGVHLEELKLNSVLRLRGICVIDSRYTHNLAAFALLVPSPTSVRVVADPPWWNVTHTIIFSIVLVVIASCLNVLYGRAIRWRLRGVFDERERLAQEMHDTLAQSFAGVGFQLEAIRDGVPKSSTKIHQQLNCATELVQHSHEEARRSITALRPQALESGDLAGALALCAKRLVEGSQIDIHSSCRGEVRPIPLRVIDTFFRIGQEALANAVLHAAANKISIQLTYEPEGIELLVYDDGQGFSTSEELRGFGIDGMRNRAERIGGVITVTSRSGGGTAVKVRVQLPKKQTVLDWPRMILKLMKGRKPHGADFK